MAPDRLGPSFRIAASWNLCIVSYWDSDLAIGPFFDDAKSVFSTHSLAILIASSPMKRINESTTALSQQSFQRFQDRVGELPTVRLVRVL